MGASRNCKIKKLTLFFRFIANNLMDSDNFNNIIEDWKYIALVFGMAKMCK